jgi:HAMP domain-containing protein
MITVCEECGRKYKLDPSRIKGKEAKFTCKSCGFTNIITKPGAEEAPAPAAPVMEREPSPSAPTLPISAQETQEWQPDFASMSDTIHEDSGGWEPSFDSAPQGGEEPSGSVVDDSALSESVIDESLLGGILEDGEHAPAPSMPELAMDTPEPEPYMPPMEEPGPPQVGFHPAAAPEPEPAPARRPEREEKPGKAKAEKKEKFRERGGSRRIGLRGKMAVLFLFIPILFMFGAGLFYLYQMNNMAHVVTGQSSDIVKQLSEKMMAQVSRTVALQTGAYLAGHPFLKKEDFNTEMDIKMLAVQKVGITGYTALYSLPDADGVWRIWAHSDPDLVGKDAKSVLQTRLGPHYDKFWKIFTGVEKGGIARGYYSWPDVQGSGFQDKFMVCTPIEGTDFVILATTYVKEFTRDVKRLETRADKVTIKTRNAMVGILAGTIILIGFIVAYYGNRLTRRIVALKEAADRISVGGLDTEIDVSGRDEIGDLAEAIGRMQESIRLSIERLRRRRKR